MVLELERWEVLTLLKTTIFGVSNTIKEYRRTSLTVINNIFRRIKQFIVMTFIRKLECMIKFPKIVVSKRL